MSNEDPVCCCGHVRDEHVKNKRGAYAECGVDDCRCCHYEPDDEEPAT